MAEAKSMKKTTDSPYYKLVFGLVKLIFGSKPKPEFILNGFDKVKAPYVIVSNHESFNDFYYLYQLAKRDKPLFVVNRYYTTMPFLKFLNKRVGMIPKKIFFDDMSSPVRIMRTLKKGTPVIIYPDPRLCFDGRTNYIVGKGGAFFKRLGVDIVLCQVNGAYFEKPKWRKTRYRTPVSVTVKRVLKPAELQHMTGEEIDKLIVDNISNNVYANPLTTYPQKDKAEGLHNILYRCCKCDGLYTTASNGNNITCSKCGKTFTIGDDYKFIEEPRTICDWYDHIREVETKGIKYINLEMDVTSVIYSSTGKKRKENGHCRLTFDGISYKSDNAEFTYKTGDKLKAMVFTSGKHIELYYNDEMYFMTPVTERRQGIRWALMVDIIRDKKMAENPS